MKKITILTFCCLIILGVNVNVFAQTPTPTVSPTTSPTPTPTVTPTPEVCALIIIKAEIEFNEEGSDKAKVEGTFSGGGFDDTADVTVNVGSSSKILPFGSFVPTADGWEFMEEIDGANVEITIEDLGDSFNFVYEADGLNLTGTSNPINIQFENGENNCEVEIRLNGELKLIGEGEVDSEIDCGDGEEDNIIIGSCDTGVKNLEIDGSSLCDEILMCADDASNHGAFVSCVSGLTNDLKKDGLLARNEKGKIQRCAARSDIGGKDNSNNLDDDSDDDDSDDDDSDDDN